MVTDITETLQQRESTYGSFKDLAEVSRQLRIVVNSALKRKNKTLDAYQEESLNMILHKIARIVNGDSNYADSWHDIGGYAKLVVDELNNKS